MQIYSVIGSVLTVVSFVLFIGIVAWAWSKRRKQAFDAAALAPFALPDDLLPSKPARTAKGSEDSRSRAAAGQGVR